MIAELREYLGRAIAERSVDVDFALDRWLDADRLGDEWATRQLRVMKIAEKINPPADHR